MKSKIKLIFTILVFGFICQSLSAASTSKETKVPRKYRIAAYTKAIEKEIGHKCQSYEENIIKTAYSYYSSQCENNWDKEAWKEAVKKGAELCKNKIAIAAAKAGEFGEKLLKALIVATKDATDSFSEWLDQKSEEYDDYKKESKKNPKVI